MATMRSTWLALLLAALVWGGGTPIRQAPSRAATLVNPFQGSSQAQKAGAKLFVRECAACHGRGRQGIGRAPSLNRPAVYRAAPGTLFWVLRNGSIRRGMPSFAHLPEAQRWQIITFLQTLDVRHNQSQEPGR
jgi:mono/diheme cytochrome c family protein